tara:strand:+ start:923 stop:1267 length:345 start_codon:yes stop_codon:yes gene_type:complete
VNERELKYGEARKRARLKWANSEHGKELSKNYMKEYRSRPEVKAKYHEYYIKNKLHWGEITKAKQKKVNNWGGKRTENQQIIDLHEEWARENGYRDNDTLHATNTERMIQDAKK